MYQKITGFAPDIDPTTPGIIKTGSGAVPSLRGVAGAPSAQDTSNDDLTATAVGAATLRALDGSVRTYAATASKIFELSGTAWTSRASGLTSGTPRFTQFGNQTLIRIGRSPAFV